MKTVKEVSELTGISVRTLHYYDEIGLFRPTEVKETGYRFYDDKAIDKLGQILVFRELDLPLADIKLIMDYSDLDRNTVLAKQREMLCAKSQRIERIIASIGLIKSHASFFIKLLIRLLCRIGLYTSLFRMQDRRGSNRYDGEL